MQFTCSQKGRISAYHRDHCINSDGTVYVCASNSSCSRNQLNLYKRPSCNSTFIHIQTEEHLPLIIIKQNPFKVTWRQVFLDGCLKGIQSSSVEIVQRKKTLFRNPKKIPQVVQDSKENSSRYSKLLVSQPQFKVLKIIFRGGKFFFLQDKSSTFTSSRLLLVFTDSSDSAVVLRVRIE